MGNDGGSIPKRSELIRTKQTRARENDADRVRQLWAFCALSKQPLRQPVVSCPLGRLYNKEAVIAFLLDPHTFGSDGHLVAGHIRSLKDLVTLRLTPNPNLDPPAAHDLDAATTETVAVGAANERDPPAPFVCPISLREMNGTVKFVYRKPCGCAMSESALREMRKNLDKAGSNKEGEEAHDDERSCCPVDGERTPPGAVEEWVTINPKEDELELMRERFEARKRQEKEDKKAAKAKAAGKRKNGSGGNGNGNADSAPDLAAPPKSKKAKTAAAATAAAAASAAPAVKAGATVSGLSATLAAKLAEQKKQQSPAIASLYAKKSDNEMKVRFSLFLLLLLPPMVRRWMWKSSSGLGRSIGWGWLNLPRFLPCARAQDKDGRSNWMTIGSYSRF